MTMSVCHKPPVHVPVSFVVYAYKTSALDEYVPLPVCSTTPCDIPRLQLFLGNMLLIGKRKQELTVVAGCFVCEPC